jgi:hypothetical protein
MGGNVSSFPISVTRNFLEKTAKITQNKKPYAAILFYLLKF